ncbi:hypothetical protein [Winogradskyella sp.]|jgi:hypothetical protein|uniref:hypothetical protein n=1 Tax=Winogradskyella sp. TaxID=1883156 RepID=UPI003F6A2D4F
MNNILLERHKDLENLLCRCRIKIEDREDPTVLDIMTDMRALAGIVTVRQTRPVSEVITNSGHRIIELNVSYLPKFIKGKNKITIVGKTLKSIEGVDIIKLIEHDNDIINLSLKKSPIIL